MKKTLLSFLTTSIIFLGARGYAQEVKEPMPDFSKQNLQWEICLPNNFLVASFKCKQYGEVRALWLLKDSCSSKELFKGCLNSKKLKYMKTKPLIIYCSKKPGFYCDYNPQDGQVDLLSHGEGISDIVNAVNIGKYKIQRLNCAE